MSEVDLKAGIDAIVKPLDAAGVQRTDKQLALLSLDDRAAFVREQGLALSHVIDEAKRRGAPYAINVGRALLVTKAELRHGEFGPWIEQQCKLKLSTAKNYMLLARHAKELRARGVNVDEQGVRAIRAMITESRRLQQPAPVARDGAAQQRAADNLMTRCITLLDHLAQHADAEELEEHLLPVLVRVLEQLKKRRARREATR